MAITRRFQAGLESNGASSNTEFHALWNAPYAIASSTSPKTGTYALRLYADGSARADIPATRQIRVGFHYKAQGYDNGTPHQFGAYSVGGLLVGFRFPNLTTAQLTVGGVVRATIPWTFPMMDYAHIGIDMKIDGAAGWVKVYKDGTEVMSYAGNTGAADIAFCYFGVYNLGGNMLAYSYFDDIFIDDTTGEGAAAVVPDYRFAHILPTGNGNYSQCMGSDGNQVDNYALANERPHNSDTTYVEADTLDEKDTYVMGDYTIPAGWTVSALIPYVYPKKTNAGVATQLALMLREDGVDWEGTAQDLASSYGVPVWERRTLDPGGAAWDQTSVNGVEAGFVGKGTF